MTDHRTTPTHYQLLKIKPTASLQEIRRAYRDLSKLYHPDTTTLPPAIAIEKFKHLNNAYATLSNPDSRTAYDYSIGISRVAVIQAPAYLNRPATERGHTGRDSAYLDPTDRPLSAGEMFALFILGITFVGCLILVFTISWTKGELVLYSEPTAPPSASQSQPTTSQPAPASRSPGLPIPPP
ncbi:MAG: J domain-containing protein [Leptolyngbyaceae cyanobacterium]